MAVVCAPMLTKDDYRRLPDAGPRFQLIEKDQFTSPHFPGLNISVAETFKR
jgi:hypothetical protein